MKRLLALLLFAAWGSGGAAAQYALQFGTAVAASGDRILVGEGRNLLLPGSVYVFERAADGWAQAAPVEPDGAAMGFGQALSTSGTTLAVGAPASGHVQIFRENDNGTWTHTATLTSDHGGFGTAVAVDGSRLLVGAPGEDDKAGVVLAYRTSDGATWEADGELTSDQAGRDGWGSALALSGNHAVVGAPLTESRTGRAVAFLHDGGGWTAAGALEAGDGEAGDRFGTALLLAGDHLAVGAPGDGSVALFGFDREADAWAFERHLLPFETSAGAEFGASLAAAGDELWVGAPGHASREGAVWRFELNDAGRVVASTRVAADGLQFRSGFGTSLALTESVAVVGARGHDNFEGAAFAYAASDDGWSRAGIVWNDSGEIPSVVGGTVECEAGEAGGFPCTEIDMLSFLTRREIGARRGIQVNDVWGWEDPETGREYALVGRTDGTSFIDLSDPGYPVYVGDLPKTATANQSLWRDIKVYRDHAFIVADGAGAHHMQIFDLRQLRDVDVPPVTFEETAIYKGIYSSHNVIVNEETGFAYAVGNDSGGETCGGALHMIDVRDPVNPTFAGCFADTRTGRSGTGATHDAQCVTYRGPDAQYRGREICLSSNGTALSIADVTDKENPVAVSVAEYPNVAYTHQGWLTEDHRYFFLNDEGDEVAGLVDATRTLIFDLTDLEDPAMVGEYMGPSSAIDHNLYIRGDVMYQTNYIEGLRLVDISDPEKPAEIGHFDTVPYGPNDNSPVLGAWSNYPYFKSGVIVVTSGREGVFFLKKQTVDT